MLAAIVDARRVFTQSCNFSRTQVLQQVLLGKRILTGLIDAVGSLQDEQSVAAAQTIVDAAIDRDGRAVDMQHLTDQWLAAQCPVDPVGGLSRELIHRPSIGRGTEISAQGIDYRIIYACLGTGCTHRGLSDGLRCERIDDADIQRASAWVEAGAKKRPHAGLSRQAEVMPADADKVGRAVALEGINRRLRAGGLGRLRGFDVKVAGILQIGRNGFT